MESLEALLSSLTEVIQKVEASLLTKIESHVNSTTEFQADQGLDFLDTKNSLLLSYLIDLTVHMRRMILGGGTTTAEDEEGNTKRLHRLTEIRTVLDKMRGLDKKLRYQIDKLLAHSTVKTTFVSSEDPLQFRPGVEDEARDSSGSSSGDDDDDDDESHGSDADDDLAAARRTVALAKAKKQTNVEDNNNDGVYRAPRMSAVPYQYDTEERVDQKEKRRLKRMRASEVAQTLRSTYGDAPDREDLAGGAELGRQREASRRLAERQTERTKFEEDNMIRLTVSRVERKERQRLMREETSNLAAVADLGNLVRDSSSFGGDKHGRRNRQNTADDEMGDRHANGKRRQQVGDRDGRVAHDSGRSNKTMMKSQNSLQAALYSGGDGDGKKKKKKTKR